MRERGLLTSALALLLVVALHAPAAQAKPIVGIGDQKATMFTDSRFDWLNIPFARIVVSWDLRKVKHEKPYVAHWLAAAKNANVRPLVTFGHTWIQSRRHVLPTRAQFRKEVRWFRRTYPWVKEFAPWNEANHCSQPTCDRPERAAVYYKVLREECPTCAVLAADVLDQANMTSWLERFQRAARPLKPRLWGLHNYLDANRRRTSGTKALLGAVPGDVWFTETGGIVRRGYTKGAHPFVESAEAAAGATDWVLKLATDNPRVRRVYFYHWDANSPTQSWDSGFVDPLGNTRPAFDVLARFRGRNPANKPVNFSFPVLAPPPPGADVKPPAPASPQPQPGATPPAENCFVVLMCGTAPPLG